MFFGRPRRSHDGAFRHSPVRGMGWVLNLPARAFWHPDNRIKTSAGGVGPTHPATKTKPIPGRGKRLLSGGRPRAGPGDNSGSVFPPAGKAARYQYRNTAFERGAEGWRSRWTLFPGRGYGQQAAQAGGKLTGQCPVPSFPAIT